MPELLDGFDGSIFDGSIFDGSKDEHASNVAPAEIDIVYHLGKGDSDTYGHTRNTSILQ